MNRGLTVRRVLDLRGSLFRELPVSALSSHNAFLIRRVAFLGAATRSSWMPMKPGETIEALKIYKDQEAPVVLQREEYPEWINTLAERDISLAQLRKMDVDEATDRQKLRFLKLTRRIEIKEKNEAAKAK